MKRDEVSEVLRRVLAEALAGDVKSRPREHPLPSSSTMRVELDGLSLQVNRITVDFGEQGDER